MCLETTGSRHARGKGAKQYEVFIIIVLDSNLCSIRAEVFFVSQNFQKDCFKIICINLKILASRCITIMNENI